MNNYMKPIVASLKQWVKDYIHDNPSEDEAVDLLTSMGFVDPVCAEDGAVYVESENMIFVL